MVPCQGSENQREVGGAKVTHGKKWFYLVCFLNRNLILLVMKDEDDSRLSLKKKNDRPG